MGGFRAKSILKNMIPIGILSIYRRFRDDQKRSKISKRRLISVGELKEDLRYAGISRGDTVMVHSSLSRLGYIDGGAKTVVDILLQAIGEEGTLLMPSFFAPGPLYEKPRGEIVVDLRYEPSSNGAITEEFRKRTGVLRSSHPFSPIIAWGKRAKEMIQDHAQQEKICHQDSPLARLVSNHAKILGLGSAIGNLSMYHVLEDTWSPFPFDPYLPAQELRYIDANGKDIRRPVRRLNPIHAPSRIDQESSTWLRSKFESLYQKHAIISHFKFGDSQSWQISADKLLPFLIFLAQNGLTIYTRPSEYSLHLDHLKFNA